MDERKLSGSPRRCNSPQLVAKKQPRQIKSCLIFKLRRREICSKRDRAFSMSKDRFRNFGLQLSKITEIVAAKDIVFALAESGLCAAFSRATNQRLCFLNVSIDDTIQNLFYNNGTDMIISLHHSRSLRSKKCRSTRIEDIKRGKPDSGFPVFESVSLSLPYFVDFDEEDQKALIYSHQESAYHVFDLNNYTRLYSFAHDESIELVTIGGGTLFMVYTPEADCVPLRILRTEDGREVKSFHHPIHRGKELDFIALLNEKLIVKQLNENLRICNLCNSKTTEVKGTATELTDCVYMLLRNKEILLAYKNHFVKAFNFRGDSVTVFEDNMLWKPEAETRNITVTNDQELVISYCKAGPSNGIAGSINVSDILTGKCLAKIVGEGGDITTLFYNEEMQEIYTGNQGGLLHVWKTCV